MKRHLLLFFTLLGMFMSGSVMAIEPVNGVYHISTSQDWTDFCEWYNSKATTGNRNNIVVRLDNDVTVEGNEMLGKDDWGYYFTGLFDGGGHTLTVNYNLNANHCAPFRILRDGTIQNLVVDGTIQTNGQFASGCVGVVSNGSKATIKHVVVKATIKSDATGGRTWGGILGYCQNGYKPTVNIENCAFVGKFDAPNVWDCGGITGWPRGYLTIRGCLVAADLSNFGTGYESSSDIFSRKGALDSMTIENCYIYEPNADSKYSSRANYYNVPTATADQMKTGELANLLNGSVNEIEPIDGVYHISTSQDWTDFCDWYNAEPTTGNRSNIVVKLDNDVTVDGNEMLGRDDWGYYFTGLFDGQGHTLTVNYNLNANHCAPFRILRDGTIQNLVVDGTIQTAMSYASGCVGAVSNGSNATIKNVVVKATIKSDASESRTWGGILAYCQDNTTPTVNIENCAFVGKFDAPGVWDCGGIVAWPRGNLTIRGCLVAADVSNFGTRYHDGVKSTLEGYSDIFSRPGNLQSSIIENCYLYEPNAESNYGKRANSKKIPTVTADQVKSGELAYLLNGSVSGAEGWGQAIGTDALPAPTADISKFIFKNVYDDNASSYANNVILDEAKGNAANITANNSVKANVKLVRKFVKGWNSVVLPFDLTTAEVEQVFGADAKVAYFSNDAANTINFNTKDGDKSIKANEPVLLYIGDDFNSAATDVTFDSVTVKSGDAVVNGDAGINSIGSYTAGNKVPAGAYFISGGQLWKSDGEAALDATRAYFTVPETSAQAKIQLVIDGSSIVTGITSVKASDNAKTNSDVYTLTGVKVGNSLTGLPKGVYIVNGHKVVKN